MDEANLNYRPAAKSENFTISRQALNEAHSAIAGAIGALGHVANLDHALEQLRTAVGDQGETYPGHEPNFVVGGSSERPPADL